MLGDHTKAIEHQFLLASASDFRLQPKQKKALKKLASYDEEAMEYLIGQFDRKDIRKRKTIIAAAEMIGDDAEDALLNELGGTNPKHSAFAAYILGKICSHKAVVPLMLATKSSYTPLRVNACLALGNIGDTAAVDNLIAALSDTTPAVRRTAALSLGKLKSKKAIPYLIGLLGDEGYAIRYTASYAIAAIGDTLSADTLLAMLGQAKTPERYHIVETVGLLHPSLALTDLMKLTEDTDYMTRGFVCQALGNYRGNYKVANSLKKALSDTSPFVRMMAENSLKSLRDKIH